MSRTATSLVTEFHRMAGAPVGTTPRIDPARVRLRLDLIAEEFKELCEAVGYDLDFTITESRVVCGGDPVAVEPDIVDALDALADITYVVNGAAVEWGLPLEAAVEEVHRSNMTKRAADGTVTVRADGKILKPDSYEPPDLVAVLDRARRGGQP